MNVYNTCGEYMVMYDEKRVKFGVHGRCMVYLVVLWRTEQQIEGKKRDVVQIQSNPAKKVGWELFELCAWMLQCLLFVEE